MTYLQHVAVEGFKGIDSLEFEPGAINVVTGRNNSGKTSLLEAIDLGVEPTNVERFGENFDNVVNYQHDECRVIINAGEDVTELRFSQLHEMEASKSIFDTLRMVLIENWEVLATADQDRAEIVDIINEELPSEFAEQVEDDVLTKAINDTFKLNVNGDRFPVVYFDHYMGEMLNVLYKSIRSKIEERFNQTIFPVNDIMGYPAQDRFYYPEGPPPTTGQTKFINFVQLSEPFDLESDEDNPVKIDDIGDFLREKEIVDNLKTFDLDYLIFEDDGEKYSVPFDHMGEGFKTLVGVLWHLFDVEGSADVVLLEEPDTHMHPGYVRQLVYFLIDLAMEEDLQLFITTHNNDFLNDFFTENLKQEEREFLEEEFRLVQLQDGAADVMDYEEAETQLKDLKLDLRGYR